MAGKAEAATERVKREPGRGASFAVVRCRGIAHRRCTRSSRHRAFRLRRGATSSISGALRRGWDRPAMNAQTIQGRKFARLSMALLLVLGALPARVQASFVDAK